MRLLASGEAPEQMLQVCEQDMEAADGAVAEIRGAVLVARGGQGRSCVANQ